MYVLSRVVVEEYDRTICRLVQDSISRWCNALRRRTIPVASSGVPPDELEPEGARSRQRSWSQVAAGRPIVHRRVPGSFSHSLLTQGQVCSVLVVLGRSIDEVRVAVIADLVAGLRDAARELRIFLYSFSDYEEECLRVVSFEKRQYAASNIPAGAVVKSQEYKAATAPAEVMRYDPSGNELLE